MIGILCVHTCALQRRGMKILCGRRTSKVQRLLEIDDEAIKVTYFHKKGDPASLAEGGRMSNFIDVHDCGVPKLTRNDWINKRRYGKQTKGNHALWKTKVD